MNTTPSPKMFPRMSLMSSAAPDPELAGAAAGAPEAGAGCFAVNESGAGVTEDAEQTGGSQCFKINGLFFPVAVDSPQGQF